MRSRGLLGCAVIAMLLPACSLDRVAVTGAPGPIDAASGLDAGSDLDAGAQPIDARVDTGTEPPLDAGRDSGADGGQDAGVDAGQDAGPPPRRGCDDIYDGLRAYQLCEERDEECELYVETGGTSCDDACSSAGGACLTSYMDSSTGDPCVPVSGPVPCSQSQGDALCVCTRIP
ncbi:MAG: hypothetical protein M3Y87_13665 [Myxococcota bacterium]|nr:hypothetical protein [Myxococcota bacterium]